MSLEDLYITVCDRCHKDIYGVAVHEGASSYHEDCFLCEGVDEYSGLECCAKLRDQPYFSVKGKRFCRKCYEKNEAVLCNKCHSKIIGCKTIELPHLGKYLHEECFYCVDCPKSDNQIGVDKQYTLVPNSEQDFLCQTCYFERFPQRLCNYCEEVIEAGATVQDADQHYYHISCFTCDRCEKPLDSVEKSSQDQGHYVEFGGNIYCPSCYNSRFVPTCAVCGNIISTDEAQITYKDEIFCETCFTCHKCGADLMSKEFFDGSETTDPGNLEIECAEKDKDGNCV